MRLKIGFASILSCLALLLGLFSFMGTASAHSVRHIHPEISIDSEQASSFSSCVSTSISGTGFTPSKGSHHNHALFSASDNSGGNLSIDPNSVRVDGSGDFSATVNICGISTSRPIFFCPGGQAPFGPMCQIVQPSPSLVTVSAEDEATGSTSNTASIEISFP